MTVRKIEIRDVFKKKRVAAYARVSTLKDAQEDSFETQVNYYDTLIKSNPDWSLVKIYSDNGFSGVSAEERPGFMEMIKDAEYKGFDILLVRSVSRFARNLMEAQLYCRKLKIFGVDVRFERERISINDPSADMAFGLLAACAQEESRSISERTKWGIHNLQAQGVLHIGNKALGYDEKDGVLTPNKDAWVIKEIFSLYADGMSKADIAKLINEYGNSRPLTTAHIDYILKNPIYAGDRYLQKQAPKNYMTHKPDPSLPYNSYKVKDAHQGIVDRKLWDKVKYMTENEEKLFKLGIKRRKDSHFLYGKVFCGACGCQMMRKLVISRGEKLAVWKCADRLKGKRGNGCKNSIVKEGELLCSLCMRLEINGDALSEVSKGIERITISDKSIGEVIFSGMIIE